MFSFQNVRRGWSLRKENKLQDSLTQSVRVDQYFLFPQTKKDALANVRASEPAELISSCDFS